MFKKGTQPQEVKIFFFFTNPTLHVKNSRPKEVKGLLATQALSELGRKSRVMQRAQAFVIKPSPQENSVSAWALQ